MHLPTEPDTTLTYLYNPSKDDFTHAYNSEPYTLPSRKIVPFPKWLADHLAKHLAQKLAFEDSQRIHFEDKVKLQLEKIYVTL